MSTGTSPAPRLLFVIDNDFGALGTVMYMLHRQPLSARTTLLLPRRAYELHATDLPIASRPYQSLQDILDTVTAASPDVVCLFSGYLLASQRLLSIRALRKLIRVLRRRGCKVATSDPYLGTFRHIADAAVPPRQSAIHRFVDSRIAKLPRVHRAVARLTHFLNGKIVQRHVGRVAATLDSVVHIYPVPVDFPQAGGGPRRISFFNPLYVRGEGESGEQSTAGSACSDEVGSGRCWLFVLAAFDLEFQEKKHGRQGLVELIVSKIREALGNGRHPTFIAPAAIAEEVSRHFAEDSGASFLPTCSFEEFHRRLLEAEIVFYWQILSTSAFFRLWNGLPVFFFDEGHNAHLLKPLRDAALKYYYLAGAPVYLDIEKPLDAAALTELSAGFRQSALEGCQRLAHLPTPEEMVDAIMELPQGAAGT